jgi:hypothetical protein
MGVKSRPSRSAVREIWRPTVSDPCCTTCQVLGMPPESACYHWLMDLGYVFVDEDTPDDRVPWWADYSFLICGQIVAPTLDVESCPQIIARIDEEGGTHTLVTVWRARTTLETVAAEIVWDPHREVNERRVKWVTSQPRPADIQEAYRILSFFERMQRLGRRPADAKEFEARLEEQIARLQDDGLDVTQESAAEAFGLSPRQFKKRLADHGLNARFDELKRSRENRTL